MIFRFGFSIRPVFVLGFVLRFFGVWKFEKKEWEKKRMKGRWERMSFVCFDEE